MSQRASQFLVSLTLLIPVGIFFWVWEYYAINIPKWDDHALKAFLLEYLQAPDFSGKVQALFRQHNEHRITITRFIALLDFEIFGALNFKRLMLYGNIILVGMIALWWVVLKNNNKPFYTLIPIPFIWLTLSHYENMYWGMAAVQNFGVVVFSVWALYCSISRRRGPFLLSLVLAALACLTSGNGLLVLPIGSVLLLLAPRWRRLVVWLAVSAGYVTVYFFNFQRSPANPDTHFGVGSFVKGYLYFLGSFAEAFPVQNHPQACLILGAILFLVAVSIGFATVFSLVRNRYEYDFAKITDLFCLGVILFVLGTALIVVYSRVGFGLEGLLTSRYKIYSFLLLLVAYLYVVIPIRGSFLSPYVSGIVFLNALYSIFSYHYHLVDAYNLRKYQTTQRFNWTFPDRTLSAPADTTLAGKLVENAPVFYDDLLPLISTASRQSFAGSTAGLTGLAQSTTIEPTSQAIEISNSNYSSQRLQDSGVYFVLSSSERYYLYPALRRRNTNRKQLFLHQTYFSPGFFAEIPFSEVAKGRYALGLLWKQGERVGILMGKDSVTTLQVEGKSIQTNW
ncbi:hypothetical protein [Persicitalea jodogahamensis]|uniref:Uncharacterized protein n=1 Tax=Persicitalea jodogahamensis TaxID=402147 RepID=A0A8J3GAA4_9BACT|nr:hypothetical protein [Persicitalea jodogahamensis]GHB81365.1 hypothetical protein GCM10007390_40240 [Persicitalea jodogahamensis]